MKKIQVFLFLLLAFQANAQWSVLDTINLKQKEAAFLYQPFSKAEWDASNFAKPEDIKWFNDARYGMFIHFGLSTYIGKDLSWGMCYTRKMPDSGHGPIPDSVWTKYPTKFKLENFNAKEWVEIAQKAGVKYIVTIAKHHDGFHLWDTKYSDFKITNTPFGRDYLKELAHACHAAGMKFGIYYSQRDWYHPDYQPIDTSLVVKIKNPPYYKLKPGISEIKAGPRHHNYIEYQRNAVRELCSNYGKVDVFWFDALYWGGMFTAEMWDSENLTRMIRELQPGIIINNRASVPGDFDTPEQRIGFYQARPWESCLTLCASWSWSPTPSKSLNQLTKLLVGAAVGNGNALLSWGPKWSGEFADDQKTRLIELGGWLKKYGVSIYNTRGGPWLPSNWGGTTHNGNKAYVHIFDNFDNKTLKLAAIGNKIVSAQSLTGGQVKFIQNKKEVVLFLENTKTDEEKIIVLTFAKPITQIIKTVVSNSRFNDPSMGTALKTGLQNSSAEPLNFNSINVENQPLTITLDKAQNVTGIQLNNKQQIGQPIKIETSIDGNNWQEIEQIKGKKGIWEIVFSKFNAGTMLPGIETKYIRVSSVGQNKFQFTDLKVFVKN